GTPVFETDAFSHSATSPRTAVRTGFKGKAGDLGNGANYPDLLFLSNGNWAGFWQAGSWPEHGFEFF
ncbi:MAG: hypothetical protein ACOC1H_04095, partial [Desulfosalsimonas sp.]